MTIDSTRPSLGRLSRPLVERLIADAATLRIGVEKTAEGCTLVDAGIDCRGGIEAGLRIAEICMGGLGRVHLSANGSFGRWPWSLSVHAADPVLACLGSQLAGWQLTVGSGQQTFYALGSGPGRAVACKEPLFEEIGYRDVADSVCLVLEVDQRPPAALIEKVAKDCNVLPSGVTLILTPTKSLAGTIQIVARVLEVALHKLHELHFPLDRVVDGMGAAPLPPPAGSFVAAMGRTNDAIIYGGIVHLFVAGPDGDAEKLAGDLPSAGSRDYGRPFAEVFKSYKGDFYAMDRLLFSPARVTVTALDSGHSFHGGALDEALIDKSFGHAPA
ncbi:MAG: methenyltetrahydromethanopterin cyclohydrolase [Dongiaceae bacterium]